MLGESCFADCESLQVVSFARDSKLTILSDQTFDRCFELKSIVLPASLEIIGQSCFFNCKKLEEVIFPYDSKLVRIERIAFGHCFHLQSLSLPPLLEFIGVLCFIDSSSFSTLIFASPSRLRQLLDVPPLWTGFKEIPDSVEVLHLCRSGRHPDSCTLVFGDESKLTEVGTSPDTVGLFRNSPEQFRYFVRATSRSLKQFRSNLEFAESA
jgi:hypothetical protein